MYRYLWGALGAVVAALLGGALWVAPPALAGGAPTWSGAYAVTFQVDQKTGTSAAARQPEAVYTNVYTFASTCSTDPCTATIVDGPAPSNSTVPQPITFSWNGAAWELVNKWQWNCLLPDGTTEWDPANAAVTYTPQADGSLKGEWTTTITSGACQGTVYIPMKAVAV